MSRRVQRISDAEMAEYDAALEYGSGSRQQQDAAAAQQRARQDATQEEQDEADRLTKARLRLREQG